MKRDFVPLRVHTRFSPLLGAIDPEEAGEALARAGWRAAAITDRGGLFGVARARRSRSGKGIRWIAGAEIAVRFPIPGERERRTAPAPLTVLAENREGEEALGRFLERLHREDRSAGLSGIATAEEFADAAEGWIVLCGGLAGPISGAYAAGRIGEARRAAEFLAGRFDRDHLFLEVSRTGSAGERLVEPFLRKLESELGIARVAADPVRYLRDGERDRLLALRNGGAQFAGGERIDPFSVEGESGLIDPEEMVRRYAEDPEPLRRNARLAARCLREAGTLPSGAPDAERDELIRIGLRGIDRLFSGEPGWRKRQAERRFWSELWRLEESGRLPAAVHLARAFRAVRRSEKGAEMHTSLLSGSLIGILAGLQAFRGSGGEILESIESFTRRDGAGTPVIEADPRSARLLEGVMDRQFPGGLATALVPLPARSDTGKPGRPDGKNPSKTGSGASQRPPTRPPFDSKDRGNPNPDPLFAGHAALRPERLVGGIGRAPRLLVWTESAIDLWGFDPESGEEGGAIGFRIVPSVLLGALRESGPAAGERGDPFGVLREGRWSGLLEGKSARILVPARRLPPRTVTDLAVLLSVAGGNTVLADLFDRIVRIRKGERKPPPLAEGFSAILRETEGIPFFQEQLLEILRVLSGRSWEDAEDLLRKMRRGNGAELAGDRALFLRQAADRSAAPQTAARVFSVLLGLAPHAARKGDVLPVAERIVRGARRKTNDPVRFACASLNAAAHRREGLRDRISAFTREGIRILPLDKDRSVFLFREEEGAIRTGLSLLPGMDREKVARFALERERGGPFLSSADLLERLSRQRYPREDLLRLARAFGKGGEREEKREMEQGRPPAEKKNQPGARRPPVPSKARRRRRGHRRRTDHPQTAFSFLEGEGGGRRESPLSSSGGKEVS